MLGASQLTYSEAGPDVAIPALLEARLARLDPGSDWHCEVRSLMFGRRMPEFGARYMEELKPAAVVLSLVTSPFTWENPIATIRRRWPRLYPLARRIAERLKKAAGGGHLASPRGWIFRVPRLLLLWSIGGEPELRVEEALSSAIETLDMLARYAETVIICGMPRFPLPPQRRTARTWQERIDRFKAGIEERCQRHHFGFYDRLEAADRAGHQIALAPDRDYADLATRTFEAGLMAGLIAERLAVASTD